MKLTRARRNRLFSSSVSDRKRRGGKGKPVKSLLVLVRGIDIFPSNKLLEKIRGHKHGKKGLDILSQRVVCG